MKEMDTSHVFLLIIIIGLISYYYHLVPKIKANTKHNRRIRAMRRKRGLH